MRRIHGTMAVLAVVFAAAAVAADKADLPPEISEHYTRMMRYHEYMDGSVPAGAVLFVGDSITQGLCTAAVCGAGVNYGIGSDTTVGVLGRLPKYASMDRAAAVVVAIGVNDLRRRDNAEILANYRKIAELITPRAPLIFSAVLPVDERVKPESPGMNARILELNRGLAEICAATRNCRLVDVTAGLADGTGNLAPEHHVGDGVHLGDKGYAVWIKALAEAVNAVGGGKNNGK